jgi:hypothetical protein
MPDPTDPPDPAAELASLRAELDRIKTQQASEETRRAIDAAITGTIDPDAARILIERAIEPASPQDKAKAITAAAKALRTSKPYLFASRTGASASGAASTPPTDEVAQAAQRARESGSRRDLVQYLRLRKNR